ncbi:MAG: hypothetical protein NVS3B18_07690 [Candidatus Dormibacteria bacterium]
MGEIEVIHQRDDLLAEVTHRISPHVDRLIGLAVAKEIHGDRTVARICKRPRERRVHLLGEHQSVDKNHCTLGPWIAMLGVGEPVSCVRESWHGVRI